MGYNTANCTMKKTHFFAVLFLAATFISTPLLLSSCGGGGGDNGGGSVKSSKKHPKNEVKSFFGCCLKIIVNAKRFYLPCKTYQFFTDCRSLLAFVEE